MKIDNRSKELKGWDFLVYTIINNYFSDNKEFTLQEVYSFEEKFKEVYPMNFHIKDKIRQVLQHLRDKGIISFVSRGVYKMLPNEIVDIQVEEKHQNLVYLISNESIPGWVKIGRTSKIDQRLKNLYNTSVPLPFYLEGFITASSKEESMFIEKAIHTIIDTLNPDLRKNTEANKREFFKMTPEEGKKIFSLVAHITAINPVQIYIQ